MRHLCRKRLLHFRAKNDRLLTATATGASPYTESYSYDAVGNITAFNGAAYSYSSAQPHAVVSISGGQSFSYDDNGNMLTRNDGTGSYTQAWDVENRLTVVTKTQTLEVTTFAYDADGSRVKTVKPDGSVTYTPFPHYEETIAGANTTTRVTYMLGGQTGKRSGDSHFFPEVVAVILSFSSDCHLWD